MSLLRSPNIYYGMGRRRRTRRRGGSWLGDAFTKAHDFIKSNKLVSRIANGLSAVGVPYAGAVGKAAGVLGYGRRRRRPGRPRRVGRPRVMRRRRRGGALLGLGRRRRVGRPRVRRSGMGRRRVYRRRRGGNLRSLLSGAHKFIKDNRLVSKGLRTFLPSSNLHKAAHTLGYGRRRRGGANFFSTYQVAAPRFR